MLRKSPKIAKRKVYAGLENMDTENCYQLKELQVQAPSRNKSIAPYQCMMKTPT